MCSSDGHVYLIPVSARCLKASQPALPHLLKYALITVLHHVGTWLINETEGQTESSRHGAEVSSGSALTTFHVPNSKKREVLGSKTALLEKK